MLLTPTARALLGAATMRILGDGPDGPVPAAAVCWASSILKEARLLIYHAPLSLLGDLGSLGGCS